VSGWKPDEGNTVCAVPRLEFDATLEAEPGGSGGALVALPADAAAVFGTRARFPVVASFNGIAYRGSTMPKGDGTFCVGVTKAIRTAGGLAVGDVIHVIIDRDDAARTVEMPPDLAAALERARLTERFNAMSYTHRKEYGRWITEAKRPETRARRLERAVELIEAGAPLS
jgi:hypothetical protein